MVVLLSGNKPTCVVETGTKQHQGSVILPVGAVPKFVGGKITYPEWLRRVQRRSRVKTVWTGFSSGSKIGLLFIPGKNCKYTHPEIIWNILLSGYLGTYTTVEFDILARIYVVFTRQSTYTYIHRRLHLLSTIYRYGDR